MTNKHPTTFMWWIVVVRS